MFRMVGNPFLFYVVVRYRKDGAMGPWLGFILEPLDRRDRASGESAVRVLRDV